MSKIEKSHVLVVDDNAETCTLLVALLQRDFVVETASDGSEAIEKMRTRRYGAVLLDLRMPLYDGFSVLDFLRESQPDALRTVIVVTAMLSRREIDRVGTYNVCDIIAKPFDIDTVLTVVKRCVDPEGSSIGGVFCAPVLFLLADLLRRRLM